MKTRLADIYRHRHANGMSQRDAENRVLARRCRCGACFCCRYTKFTDRLTRIRANTPTP